MAAHGVVIHWGPGDFNSVSRGRILAAYVIGSTLTSTIPGISIAGEIPLVTLFTPALDAEYVYYGEAKSLNVIPTTPTGIPTPAIITRVSLELSRIPYLFIDAGSYIDPKIPLLRLSNRTIGRRIDHEDALPRGLSRRIFEEARSLGERISRGVDVVLIGESIPGGTTTAMAILEGLDFEGGKLVSSSMKSNPVELKMRVVSSALERLRNRSDPFEVNDVVGDPVHISIAGLAMGSLKNSTVLLAGGTQMLAVLALMGRIKEFDQDRVILTTTRWIIRDKGNEIVGFIRKHFEGISVAYVDLNFNDSPYWGLRAYEEGFVKEGVGAGGTALVAVLRGAPIKLLVEEICREYGRVVKLYEHSQRVQ